MMAFTPPPTFPRPAGDASMLGVFGTELVSWGGQLEQVGAAADRFDDNRGSFYWDGQQPDDVFWAGGAQFNYVESMARRLRLMELAGRTFAAAGEVLTATAGILSQTQLGVDEAQSVANQRASADAASPVPTSFEQEQFVANTSVALAGASASEAAAQLRALAGAVPGYVPPAVAGAGPAARTFGAGSGELTDGTAFGAGTGAGPTGAGVGHGAATGTDETTRAEYASGRGTAGAGVGGPAGTPGAGGLTSAEGASDGATGGASTGGAGVAAGGPSAAGDSGERDDEREEA